MEQKKLIQLPRYKINMKKQDAISAMTSYINSHLDEFTDGEEITLRYLDNDGVSQCSVNAIVDKAQDNSYASLSVEIGEYDTVKIIETEEEPEDKDSLWLTDIPEEETLEGYKTQLQELKKELSELKSLVERHDYAFRGTMNSGEITSGGSIAGGDIITNSQKYYLENSNNPEKPEDAPDSHYAEEDFNVTDFDLYLGNSKFFDYYSTTDLYKGQKYYLKFKFFNQAGEEVRMEDSNVIATSITSNNIEVADFISGTSILIASKSGTTDIYATIYFEDGSLVHDYPSLIFKYNQEPYYEKYEEPNVHHLLIKSASNYNILNENKTYLCANELIWCIENNSLYIYAKVANGSYQLVKINGGGGGETGTSITYRIDESTKDLIITGESATYNVNTGIITLTKGAVLEEGILKLTDIENN